MDNTSDSYSKEDASTTNTNNINGLMQIEWEVYCCLRTSSEDLANEESPILFLEIEITSWPHTEKPDTPSLCPLKVTGIGKFLQETISEAIRKHGYQPNCKIFLMKHQHFYFNILTHEIWISIITFSSPKFSKSCQESWKLANALLGQPTACM